MAEMRDNSGGGEARPRGGARRAERGFGVGFGTVLAACVLVAAVVVTVGLPVVGVGYQLLKGASEAGVRHETTPWSWGSIVDTFLYTGAIGVLGTAMALPAAWMARRRSAVWAALMGVPLLMPTYLAYAGWGLVRGPGSWVGDWLGRGPPWMSTGFDRVLAVVGLSLWAWPLGAFVIGAGARRIPSHLLDALDLESGAWWRKARVVMGMLGPSIGASVGAIALVMAGSAIPLHLAQADTYSIHLWRFMLQTSEPATVWRVSMPLMVVAGVGAGVIVRWMGRERVSVADEGDVPERRISAGIRGFAIGVWVMSVIAPGVLFAWHIRHWAPVEANSLVNFWRQNTAAVGFSSEIAGVVAGLVGVMAMAVYALRSASGAGARRMAGVGMWVMLAAGLVPGVLVGSATLAFWNAPFIAREAGDSMWPTVLAHTARFGFLGALAGWWLASLETADERGARLMLGGETLRAWVVLCLRPRWGVVAGIALAAGALSLHEIESTVIVQPPGPTSLAQYVLDKLHYNRNEELCAASVNLFAVGIVLAVTAGVLVGRGRRWPRY